MIPLEHEGITLDEAKRLANMKPDFYSRFWSASGKVGLLLAWPFLSLGTGGHVRQDELEFPDWLGVLLLVPGCLAIGFGGVALIFLVLRMIGR